MFEALVITLREGVEAALVIAIALAILQRRGLDRLRPAVLAGAAAGLVVSFGVAVLASRLTYNEELAEGIAMLIGSVLVATLVVWMWKSAPHFKHEIESGIERATGGGSAGIGMFLFAFAMVFREGVETAVFLAAADFNSQGLGLWLGATIGLGLSLVFGVLFARGSLKIPLKPFFSVTSAVLMLIAVQLLIGGLHELSEAQVLPASRTEMAIIGPVVKNELLLFTLTVAVAAGWLLFGARSTPTAAAEAPVAGPEARLVRAALARDASRRRWTGLVALAVVGCLTTAFVQGSKIPDKAPAQPLAVANGAVTLDGAPLADQHIHFYEAALPNGPLRFFAIKVGDEIKTCYDACEICGDKGYFESKGALICRNCTAPIVPTSIGRSGGCNPIPIANRQSGATVTISAADLEAGRSHLGGR